jgi:hypothetical protein
MAVEPLPTPCGLKRTYAPVSLVGPWRTRPRIPYSPMTRPQRLGCLYGTLVVFAILGVMFFLGAIVPAVVEVIL